MKISIPVYDFKRVAAAIIVSSFVTSIKTISAEWSVDLLTVPINSVPPGWQPALIGGGMPPEWKVILEQETPLLTPITTQQNFIQFPVIAQLSQDPIDERFLLLIYTNQTFRDFRAEIQFKLIGGQLEQMAGLAFRLKDTNNFYVIRASRLGSSFRFYKVIDGKRSQLIGPTDVKFETNRWYTLVVECEGNFIRSSIDGKVLIPELSDFSLSEGYIALWTKSDSMVYFRSLKVTYTPLVHPIEDILKSTLKKYNRLLDLKIYAPINEDKKLKIVAAKNSEDIGKTGGEAELKTLKENRPYAGKIGNRMIVNLPLHDKNGEPIAVVQIVMRSFLGQTRENAVLRSLPVAKEIERELLKYGESLHNIHLLYKH